MTIDILAKEGALGRNINFGGENYQVMQFVGDQLIQCVGFNALPYCMRGIMRLDKLSFANIRLYACLQLYFVILSLLFIYLFCVLCHLS